MTMFSKAVVSVPCTRFACLTRCLVAKLGPPVPSNFLDEFPCPDRDPFRYDKAIYNGLSVYFPFISTVGFGRQMVRLVGIVKRGGGCRNA